MNSPHVIIGAVVGGILGAVGGGFGAKKLYKPKKNEKPDETPTKTKKKYTIFNVDTQTLNKGSEVFIPLQRFYDSLRHKEEFSAFANAVNHLDNLHSMEFSLHSKEADSKNSNLISFAQRALNSAVDQLKAIVEFGDTVIPSATRRNDLEKLIESVKSISEEIIQNMTNLIASQQYLQ